MATNYDTPGREYPSREDVYESEREDRERQNRYQKTEDRVNEYLRTHPSASWADAYHTLRKK